MRLRSLYFAAILIVSAIVPGLATGQAPADFSVIAVSGGSNVNEERQALLIDPSGSALFSRTIPTEGPSATPNTLTFTLTPSQLAGLWQTIQAQNFFSLLPEYSDPLIQDRSYARISILANGVERTVRVADVLVPAFDAVLVALNAVTPGAADLSYDTSAASTWTERTLCEIAGKTDSRGYTGFDADGKENEVSPIAGKATDGEAHGGTVISHNITLAEAVRRGAVELKGKGGYFGDRMSITGDNTANQQKPEVTTTIYIQFYGPDATAANAETVKKGIEQYWNNKTTTDGKTFKVNVVTRVSDSVTPPGTAGYHNVQLSDAQTRSYVSNFGNFKPNEGTGGGSWQTGKAGLESTYAHEAGHLMGIEDQYNDYTWGRDGKWHTTWPPHGEVTTDALADQVAPAWPGWTKAQILAYLNRRDVLSVSAPYAGQSGNLMGWLTGSAQGTDVDALAGKAGLVIDIKPGDILVNKNQGDQNLLITHGTQVFVKPGEKKTINGLYTACIDNHDGSPDFDQRYDVAPNLAEWAGIEAAGYLLRLANYMDQEVLYCGSNYTAQQTVWRLTDNSYTTDTEVSQILAGAGIEIGTTSLDFPRMNNPNSGSGETTVLVPFELLVPELSPDGQLIQAGSVVRFTGAMPAPLPGLSMSFTWTLQSPAGSTAALSGAQTLTPSFQTDRRGTYVVSFAMNVLDGTGTTVHSKTLNAHVTAYDAWTDTFERSGLKADPFRWWNAPTAPWSTTEARSSTGLRSARSGAIDHSGVSDAILTINVPAQDDVSFSYLVSSEARYDFLIFYVDGTEVYRWSGEDGWGAYRYSLTAGTHVLKFSYTKDGSSVSGDDAAYIDDLFLPVGAVVTATEGLELPAEFALGANYPNPFNPVTTIPIEVSAPEQVRLEVFDAAGRLVRTLVDRLLPAGVHEVRFDATDLPSGVYAYRLTTPSFTQTRTMVLLR